MCGSPVVASCDFWKPEFSRNIVVGQKMFSTNEYIHFQVSMSVFKIQDFN